MKAALRSCAVAAVIAVSSFCVWSQAISTSKHPPGTESIGDAVRAEDKLAASQLPPETSASGVRSNPGTRITHVLYVHGINQVGAGDSLLLRVTNTIAAGAGGLYGAGTPYVSNAEGLASNGIGGPNSGLMNVMNGYATGSMPASSINPALSSALNCCVCSAPSGTCRSAPHFEQ